MSAALNLQMAIKVLDRGNDALALLHARAGAQDNRVPFLPRRDRRMGVVGVAPWRAAVDEGLELPGNIRPVGRGDTDDGIRTLKRSHQLFHVIMHDAFGSLMTAPATPAEGKAVVINTYTPNREALRELPGDDASNLSRRTVSYGAAVNNQRVHIIPP